MKDDEFIPEAARWLAWSAPTPQAMVRFSSGEWDALPEREKQRLKSAFEGLRQRIAAAHPDVLIVVSPDHWSNFFLDNVPAVCIGIGETNEGPPEPWMKAFPHRKIPGHPALALDIVSEAMKQGFEAFRVAPPQARSRRVHSALAHGPRAPAAHRAHAREQHRAAPALAIALPHGASSCAGAIRSFPANLKVGVLATGGLSHSIGEPTMGVIYDDFDRETIRLFSSSEEQLISFLDKNLPTHGNGSEEVRNWLVAHGSAGARGFELVDYLPVPKVIVGCGFASWTIRA